MLRKRARSTQKNQQMGHLATTDSGSESCLQFDNLGQKQKTSSLFSVPGLFVGLSPKGLSDCDSVRSPTSPLDLRIFSNLGNPYRSPGSPRNGFQKAWDCSKVGLSIVDSLDEDVKGSGKVIIRSSESKNILFGSQKNILFGSQVRIKTPNFQAHTNPGEAPKSLPRNFAISPHKHTKSSLQKGSSDVLFEIGEGPFDPEPSGKVRSCSLDGRSFSNLSRLANRNSKLSSGNSCVDDITPQFIRGSSNSNNFSGTDLCHLTSTTLSVGSPNGFIGSLSASEIELSEDYTCVISHGPNPKKTHIYGDCVLECHSDDMTSFGKKEAKEVGYPQVATTSAIPTPFPSDDFLNFCYYCNKKLVEGEDIYMYRGEKAFCSLNCRAQEIMIDEALEKATNKSSEGTPKLDDACIMMIDAP